MTDFFQKLPGGEVPKNYSILLEKLAEISDDFQSDTVCDENINIDIVWSTLISVLCLQLLASCASLDARHVLALTQNVQKLFEMLLHVLATHVLALAQKRHQGFQHPYALGAWA